MYIYVGKNTCRKIQETLIDSHKIPIHLIYLKIGKLLFVKPSPMQIF
jgi:hypothetical protein